MREIVLDTETTGLKPEEGDRIVEIGCVELQGGIATGRSFHRYLNPQRPVPEEAVRVHGLDDERLAGEPLFADIAGGLLEFLGDSPLVAHNAEFDIGFLDMELGRLGHAPIDPARVIDTLALARRELPRQGYGGPYNLDALCRHLGVAAKPRGLHGALLDAQLLVQVYQRLSGVGEQMGFGLADSRRSGAGMGLAAAEARAPARPRSLASLLSAEEDQAHRRFVATLGAGKTKPLWQFDDG